MKTALEYTVLKEEKYDCEKCEYNTGGVFNRNKKCEHCTVDSKDLKGKPSCFKEKQQ